MADKFVTEDVCNVKHKEVEALEKNVEKLFDKMDSFRMWMFIALGGIIANLVVALISKK